MMVRLSLCSILLAVGLSGCAAGSPGEIATRRGDALLLTTSPDLVAAYAWERKSPSLLQDNATALRKEIDRRHLFTDEQWSRIEGEKIRIGDPEPVVWASWGPPDRIDSLTTAAGERRGLVYEKTVSIVYIEDGKVAAILD